MASELRVNTSTNRSGLGTITYTDTGAIVSGIVTAASFVTADKIIHDGDTNTAIRFPAADTITAETAGSERLRIDSNGNINFGAVKSVAFPSGTGIQVYHSANPRIKLTNNTTGNSGTDGTQIYLSSNGDTIIDNKDSEDIIIHTNAAEKLRITTTGRVGIGTDTPGAFLDIGDNLGALPGLHIRNHPAAGGFDNIYLAEFRHAFGSVQHAMLIHAEEAADARRVLDVSDSNGIFATFTNGKVGIGTEIPTTILDVAPSDKSGINFTNSSNNSILDFRSNEVESCGRIRVDESSGGGFMDFYTKTTGGSITKRLSLENGGNVLVGALNTGRLIVGHTATRAVAGGFATLQVQRNSSEGGHFIRTSNDNGAIILALAKSRSSGGAVCQAGDKIGVLGWYPHDGTDCNHAAAEIHTEVATGIGGNDVPGHMVFKTNGGTTTTTERLRITSGGNIQSTNSVQSGGNSTGGFQFAGVDTACVLGIQQPSSGADTNAAFQIWDGASNNLRINYSGLIKTSKGIDFSGAQTNQSGMENEVLGHYEEGTWTPTNSIGLTLTNNNGAHYVRVGNLCTVWFDVSFSGASDSAQCSIIQSLPFTAEDGNSYHGQSNSTWYSNTNNIKKDFDDDNTIVFIANNGTDIKIWNMTGGHLRVRSWAVGRRFRGTMSYRVKS